MKEAGQVEFTPEDIEGLIQRLETETLSGEDLPAIKAIIRTYLMVIRTLQDKKATIKKLLGMLFGSHTEKAKTVLEGLAASGKSSTVKGAETVKDIGQKPRGHGRKGASAYTGAEKIIVPHPTIRTGDMCPGCDLGKVYPLAEPGVFVRITGGAPLQSQVWEMEKLRCNLCGEIFAAALPEEAGNEKYDETAGAMVPLLRYGSGIPFNRLEQLQDSLGCPLPASTQWEIADKAAKRGASAVYDELMRQGAQGRVIYNDDTTMKILAMIGNHDDGRSGSFTTGMLSIVDDKKIVLFRTGRKHAGENMTDLLRQRAPEAGPPIQMCDALSRNTSKEFNTILANCLTHGRRNFVDVADNFPEECSYVIETVAEVYKNDKITKEEKLTPFMRLQYHQAHSGPLMKRLHEWMTDQIQSKKTEPNSGLGKAISYMIKHWEPLTLFLRVEDAPLDNNACEQVLKRAILHRNNSLFYKTLRGALVGDIFMSLIHTCKLQKINPFDYIVALQKHHHEVSRNPSQWLPWNYQAALAGLSA
jgi:transposase